MNEIMKLTKGFLMLPYAAPNCPGCQPRGNQELYE
jgi:hypothetical protein